MICSQIDRRNHHDQSLLSSFCNLNKSAFFTSNVKFKCSRLRINKPNWITLNEFRGHNS